MTKDEALKMAIEVIEAFGRGCDCDDYFMDIASTIDACKKALETPECNPHPKAPHGFNRNASHSAGRYVCECEGWQLEWQGLTSEEIESLDLDNDVISVIFQTEMLLKEKNT